MRLFRNRKRTAVRRPGPKRVLILSADVGEGHAAAARAMAEQLSAQAEPVEVTVIDGLHEMGHTLKAVVEDGYRIQLRFIPWTYTIVYWLLEHIPPVRWNARFMLCLFGARPLRRRINSHDPDVVVSTYPAVTVVMARLRRQGKIRCPTIATITDMTGLFFWAQPGVDMHLVMYGESMAPVERIAGPDSVRLVQPLISRAFLRPRCRAEARRALGLPEDRPTLLVSGGGWGLGDLVGAVQALIDDDPEATVVCLAGRSEPMRRKLDSAFGDRPNVRVLGFTERMDELLAAADVLVHSTGGVTCLEAMARGCPVVSYGLPVGHAKINTQAMADLGLVRLASNRSELVALVGEAHRERAAAEAEAAGVMTLPGLEAADAVLGVRRRVVPAAAWRPPLQRAAGALSSSVLLAGWVLSTDETASLAARVLKMRPVANIATALPEAPLIVRVPQSVAPIAARWLDQQGVHATFALAGTPSMATLRVLRAHHEQVLPELGHTGGLHWLGTRGPLRREARMMRLGHTFFFLESQKTLTVGQLLQARRAGGRPVKAAVSVNAGDPRAAYGPVRAGDIVVVTLGGSPSSLRGLSRVVDTLESSGLEPVPLSALAPSPGATKASSAGDRTRPTAPAANTLSAAIRMRVGPTPPTPSWKSTGASATGTTV